MFFDTLKAHSVPQIIEIPNLQPPRKADISRSLKPSPQPSLVPYQTTVAED
jgi:hypothetical protein